MPTPFILVFGLTVATCVIAYWSDNLGKKLGKKRISLFGLRPRQTATLITMASSWGIMILTLVVLLAASPTLSDALLRYDRVNQSNIEARELNSRLTNDNARLNTNLISLQDLRDKLTRQVRRSRTRVEQTEQSRRRSVARLGVAQKKLRTAQRGEKAARRRASAAQKRSANAQRRLAQAQKRFATVQRRLQQNQERLSSLNARLGSTNGLLARARTRLKKAQGDYNRVTLANRELSKTNSRLDTKNVDTLRELAAVNRDLITAQTNFNQLKKEVAELESQRGTLLQQREQLIRDNLQLGQVRGQLAMGNLSFRGEQILAEGTVPANLGYSETQRQITDLIERGREIVKQAKTPDGAERSLEIILPVDGGVAVSEADIVQQVSNYLAILDTPASVRLIAAVNHAQSDPIIYTIVRVVPIETKFMRGETITTGTIDGSLGDAGIFNQLLELVNTGERIAREQKGIDPIPTRENPFFYANGTNERIFEALHTIQATGKKVPVRLLAAQDITTVEPLRVRFEVESSTG